jgi:hypothetical protein
VIIDECGNGPESVVVEAEILCYGSQSFVNKKQQREISNRIVGAQMPLVDPFVVARPGSWDGLVMTLPEIRESSGYCVWWDRRWRQTDLTKVLEIHGGKDGYAWDGVKRACRAEESIVPFCYEDAGRIRVKARQNRVVVGSVVLRSACKDDDGGDGQEVAEVMLQKTYHWDTSVSDLESSLV